MVTGIKIHRKKSILLAAAIVFFLLLDSSWIFMHVFPESIRHIVSFVVLLVSLKIVNKRISIYKNQLAIIWVTAIYFYGHFVSQMSVLNLIDIVILPLVIAGCSGCIKTSDRKTCSIAAIFLFLLNSLVCIYEYKNGVNLFYFDMNNMIRFRSTGIWGHPLYTAVIEAATMFFILLSEIRKVLKICFWFLGLSILFMCDARSAIVAVVACTVVLLYWQKVFSLRNTIYIVAVVIVSFYLFEYLAESDLGGKLFTKTSSGSLNYDGAEYRLIAIKILFDLDFATLLTGVENQFEYVHKYGVICAENGFVARVLVFGLPIAIMTFYLNIKTLLYICKELSMKYKCVIVALLIVSAITNQSLLTGYVWNTYMLMYLLLVSPSLKNK